MVCGLAPFIPCLSAPHSTSYCVTAHAASAAGPRHSRCIGSAGSPPLRCALTVFNNRQRAPAPLQTLDHAAVDVAQVTSISQRYSDTQDSSGPTAGTPAKSSQQTARPAGSPLGAAGVASPAVLASLANAAVPQRLAGCPECSSSGRVLCKECEGRGFLKRGGYNKKNPLSMSRITGSKWTAMQETLGWRHFRVLQQRKLDKHTVYLLLQASCDSTAQLWVNAQNLRNRASWAAGWLQMSEIQGLGAEIQGAGHKCQSCSGLGYKACVVCDGTGRPQLIIL